MFRLLFALMLLVLWVSGARAEDPLELPKGLPPSFVLAKMGKDGRILVRRVVVEMVPVLKEKLVEVNGEKRKVQFTENMQVSRVVEGQLDGKSVQVFGTDGKQVEAKAVEKALEKETPVLLAAGGNKVDPFYLRFIKDGTLILVAPMPATTPAPVPVPVPKKE
jgi:hypothetical protein